MGGFERVLRRVTMTAFAFGLAFGIPNFALAQTPKVQTARLPWQTTSFVTNIAPYDKDWTRVLSDTQQLLRRFATSYPYKKVLRVAPKKTRVKAPLWVSNVRTYVPPAAQSLQITVGTIRTTLTPVEFTSGTVRAESRTMNGVLAGFRIEMVD